MDLDRFILLVYKELKGTITKEEKFELTEERHRTRANENMYDDLEKIWNASPISTADIETDLAKVNRIIGLNDASIVSLWPKFFKALGIFLLLVAFSLLIYQKFYLSDQSYFAQKDMEIKLTDSTMVYLKEGSSLRIKKDFETKREVTLIGKAFFEVNGKNDKSFLVNTGESKIKVLGTQFTIDATRGRIVTSVRDGRVKFTGEFDEAVINKNEVAILDPDLNLTKHAINVENFNYWIDDQFVYNQMPLKDVLKQISYIFDISVNSDNPLMLDCQLSGTFETDDGVKLVNQIAQKLDMTIKKNALNRFTMTGGQCTLDTKEESDTLG